MRKSIIVILAGLFATGVAAAGEQPGPNVRARAKVNPAALFSDTDYPAAARAAGQQGTVGFRLDVGANGRVTHCTVTSSSGSESLDYTTCILLRSRARFTPALDESGQTVADKVNGKIVWTL